jgi:hypothetical protein
VVGEAWSQFCTEKKSPIEKSFVDIGLNIASNGSEDSKLLIKGYKHGKLEIGDWSQIDDNNGNCKGFQEVPQNDELDQFIKEEEVYITTNYHGLLRLRLQGLMKERGLAGLGLRRAQMAEVLQEDDRISQLYCTEWQLENYHYNIIFRG